MMRAPFYITRACEHAHAQEAEPEPDAPPDPGAPSCSAPGETAPQAYFAPNSRWNRPSDYIAHLAGEFEKGNTTAPGKKKKKKKLSNDQVLFLAGFAHACNQVWDDEQDGVSMEKRRCFSFLLMGQGGSGKTAVVQEIVLPAVDFIFPPEVLGESSSLIACSSWAQAQNISTLAHKAVSCHNAAMMRVQSLRNRDMQPGEKKSALERKWCPKKLLVLEEVSMISPALYNMLLYRSYHGRKDRFEISQERLYDRAGAAFGRMPLVIHLGDFLQLRPTAGLSLLEDMHALSRDSDVDIPAEYQAAARLFLGTKLCYELTGTNRFRADAGGRELKELIEFMRDPKPEHSEEYRRAKHLWDSIRIESGPGNLDPRFHERRFQEGHMLAMFWETVAPWTVLRAKHDARALSTPLFLLQAADHAVPALSADMAAKLTNHYNPLQTGGMHGMLVVHVGMRVRLTDALCKEKGLVKDSEGVLVRIEVDPRDEDAVATAFQHHAADSPQTVYLCHVPLGLWIQLDKYEEAPFNDYLAAETHMARGSATSLLFLTPTTTLIPFTWRDYKVTRTGFPVTHAMVRTSTACQGKTFDQGVVIDCARRETGAHPTSDGDWWLHIYVMVSRATSIRDLLLLRAPESDWLLRGPPENLRQRLQLFRARVGLCHSAAKGFAENLGFAKYLR